MSTGVGKRIKEARIRIGLTQEELALKMGKSKSLISKVENGLDNMTTDKIMEYAKALDITPGYLMGWTEETINTVNHIKKVIMDSKPKKINGIRIPVLGRVAAGIPICAIEEIIDYEEIPEEMASSGEYFISSSSIFFTSSIGSLPSAHERSTTWRSKRHLSTCLKNA